MGAFQLTTSIRFPLGPRSYLEHSASLSVLFICDSGEQERERQNEWGVGEVKQSGNERI